MKSKQHGFTLVELMLAMVFLSAILLICASVIVQSFGIYNKGLAIKQINQIGRTLTEDMTRAANSGNLVTDSAPGTNHVLCLGSSVYIWNTVQQTRASPPRPVKVFEDNTDVNLVKVETPGTGVCTSDIAKKVNPDTATSLLSSQVRVLSATIQPVQGASSAVNVRFVFGTYDSDATSPVNPRETPVGSGTYQCDATGLGNYCAFGVYSTTLYLPNAAEGS